MLKLSGWPRLTWGRGRSGRRRRAAPPDGRSRLGSVNPARRAAGREGHGDDEPVGPIQSTTRRVLAPRTGKGSSASARRAEAR